MKKAIKNAPAARHLSDFDFRFNARYISTGERSPGTGVYRHKIGASCMAWKFRKHFKILRNIHLNVGKKGINSVTLGRGWFTTNVTRKGVKQNLSARGTGLSYQSKRVPFFGGSPNTSNSYVIPQDWTCPQCQIPTDAVYCGSCGQARQGTYQHLPSQNNKNAWTAFGVILIVVSFCVGITVLSNLLGRVNLPSNSSPGVLQSSPSPTPLVRSNQSANKVKSINTNANTPRPLSSTPLATTAPTRTALSPYHLGPRGGCYYMNSSGAKTYVEHSYCK